MVNISSYWCVITPLFLTARRKDEEHWKRKEESLVWYAPYSYGDPDNSLSVSKESKD